MVLTNKHQKANRKKGNKKKRTKLKVELSDLEVSSIAASLGKSSHDIEENLKDEKTGLWLAKIRNNLIRQAKKQGMTHPILSK